MTTINSNNSTLSALTLQSNSLGSYLNGQSDESSYVDGTVALMTQKANLVKSQSSATSGGVSSSAGSAALQKALKELRKGKNGTVTYSDVKKYQKDLEEEFSVGLRIDVAKKGVDLDQPFSLKLDPNGKVSVECDNTASKAIIEKHLKENESVAEKFAYIQALSNLERARQVNGATGLNPSAENTSVELQSAFMESFFNNSLETNFTMATTTVEFKGPQGDTSFYTGLNISV